MQLNRRNSFGATALLVMFLLSLFEFTRAQTTLSPGDIAVIAFKTNTSTDAGDDAVKLVTLVDLDCNTTFIVTDNNWNGTAWACNNDESALQITCNSVIAAGSVFYIDYDAAGNPCTCSGGPITRTDLGGLWGTNFGFNSGGDNVYVLQGTRAAPSFVYAFKHNGGFSPNTCSDKDQANIPSNLTLGTSAIVMPSTKNQWNFNCVINSGTKATILAAIGNTANWISNTTHVWDNTNGIFSVSTGIFPYGVLAVSGAGCGCLANCQLAYAGGVNCGSTGVTGNCTAGYQNVSATITVPAGCTYNVIAQMKNRTYGCSSSGADGNCQTCDALKVDIAGGTKLFQQGASNASLSDSYSLTGPGTIVVSGRADRSDEIITYSVQPTPCNCLVTVLPIELAEFSAKKDGRRTEVSWTTLSEKNNSYFTVERAADAATWEALFVIAGQGNSSMPYSYKVYDTSPLTGISYYRLRQTDNDGTFSYSKIVAVDNGVGKERKIVKRYNLMGQEADDEATGLLIVVYDDGTVEKAYR